MRGTRSVVRVLVLFGFLVAPVLAQSANKQAPCAIRVLGAPTLGHALAVSATYMPQLAGCEAYVFAGGALGQSDITLNGVNVSLPVTGSLALLDEFPVSAASNRAVFVIPNDPSLVGTEVYFVSVVVDPNTGAVVYSNIAASGPILEDGIS